MPFRSSRRPRRRHRHTPSSTRRWPAVGSLTTVCATTTIGTARRPSAPDRVAVRSVVHAVFVLDDDDDRWRSARRSRHRRGRRAVCRATPAPTDPRAPGTGRTARRRPSPVGDQARRRARPRTWRSRTTSAETSTAFRMRTNEILTRGSGWDRGTAVGTTELLVRLGRGDKPAKGDKAVTAVQPKRGALARCQWWDER